LIATDVRCSVRRMDSSVAISFGTSEKDGEATLVSAAREGDSTSLQMLFSRYERRIFCLASKITRNASDAEDVTQEAFLKAIAHLDRFEGNSRFYTWLVRITVNEALTKLRKRRRHQISPDDSIGTEDGSLPMPIKAWEPNPEELCSQNEFAEILMRAIAELHPALRAVFELRVVQELSTEEAACLLGISVAAAKARLLRARQILREKLKLFVRGIEPYPTGRSATQLDDVATQHYPSPREREKPHVAQN
jgi:RNA polymerase sigma-70 factor (ECF subfamily)